MGSGFRAEGFGGTRQLAEWSLQAEGARITFQNLFPPAECVERVDSSDFPGQNTSLDCKVWEGFEAF